MRLQRWRSGERKELERRKRKRRKGGGRSRVRMISNSMPAVPLPDDEELRMALHTLIASELTGTGNTGR